MQLNRRSLLKLIGALPAVAAAGRLPAAPMVADTVDYIGVVRLPPPDAPIVLTDELVRDQIVAALVSLEDKIYLGGAFSTLGGVAVGSLASWNGAAWSALAEPSAEA